MAYRVDEARWAASAHRTQRGQLRRRCNPCAICRRQWLSYVRSL